MEKKNKTTDSDMATHGKLHDYEAEEHCPGPPVDKEESLHDLEAEEYHPHWPGPGDDKEESLRAQADAARREFIREHQARAAAEERNSELAKKLASTENKLEAMNQELEKAKKELAKTTEEKNFILKTKRNLDVEKKQYPKQVAQLQENLREMEKERAILTRPQIGAFQPPTPWTCRLCTLENAAAATKCEVCMEPKPVPSSPWADRVVCDG